MFKVQGKVVVKETGIGIPGLIIHAFDLDIQDGYIQKKLTPEALLDKSLSYDSLGSVSTSKDGHFSIDFEASDFNVVGKQDSRPELFIVVTRPEDEDEKPGTINDITLYVSRPIRLKAGKTETYHIRILRSTLERFEFPFAGSDLYLQKEVSPSDILEEQDRKAAIRKELIQGSRQIDRKIVKKVEEDFAAFSLSGFKPGTRNAGNYLGASDDLNEKQAALQSGKLESLRISGSNRSMKLNFTETDLRGLGLWGDGVPVSGEMPAEQVKSLFATNSLLSQDIGNCHPTFTESDLGASDGGGVAPIPPAGGSVVIGPDVPIRESIQSQLSTATSPETALKYDKVVDQDYKNDKVCETVNLFSLCGGPADVTSYHDFHSVQIAFEHVWTELFDKDIAGYGKKLYSEVVKTEEGYGLRVEANYGEDADSPHGGAATRMVSTVDDLSQLLRDLASGSHRNEYLTDLVDQLQQRLSEPYRFTVFAPNSINYGVVFTFRQKWEPVNYQVGKLVSSLPLAPKEMRKYSVKRMVSKSKNEKYLDDREFKGKSESTSTARAESEIIKRATNNTSFGMNTHASVDMEMFEAGIETTLSNTSEKFSQDTKKNFREAVLNAVEEYRKQNKTEIEFGWKDETNTESSVEISNPNDEITVTYLFYELQRQYDISEKLHKLQPVILVANEVPRPDQIDNDWLLAHAWILKRVILDESFLPAINQLNTSSVGDNLAINNLRRVLERQQEIVAQYTAQIVAKTQVMDALYARLESIAAEPDAEETDLDRFNIARSIFDPIGALLSGGAGALNGDSGPTQAERISENLQTTLERNEKENKELAAQLLREQNSLLQITDKYNKEVQSFFDRQTTIMQLRIHVKDNILYYMQAIWDYEPADQRYFRLYNLDIAWFRLETEREYFRVTVPEYASEPRILPGGRFEIILPMPPFISGPHDPAKRKLVDVADLDKILGYKGNYMIFPAKENSYLHEFMIQEFIDNSTGGIKDADDFANFKTQDLVDYLKCVRKNDPEAFEREKDHVIAMINERLQSPRKEKERVVIPTNSLFIEALPGKHPIMEDFKLAHRALDVKKVQAEVRHAELENLRLAARLLEGETEDPDIEKMIVER